MSEHLGPEFNPQPRVPYGPPRRPPEPRIPKNPRGPVPRRPEHKIPYDRYKQANIQRPTDYEKAYEGETGQSDNQWTPDSDFEQESSFNTYDQEHIVETEDIEIEGEVEASVEEETYSETKDWEPPSDAETAKATPAGSPNAVGAFFAVLGVTMAVGAMILGFTHPWDTGTNGDGGGGSGSGSGSGGGCSTVQECEAWCAANWDGGEYAISCPCAVCADN